MSRSIMAYRTRMQNANFQSENFLINQKLYTLFSVGLISLTELLEEADITERPRIKTLSPTSSLCSRTVRTHQNQVHHCNGRGYALLLAYTWAHEHSILTTSIYDTWDSQGAHHRLSIELRIRLVDVQYTNTNQRWIISLVITKSRNLRCVSDDITATTVEFSTLDKTDHEFKANETSWLQ